MIQAHLVWKQPAGCEVTLAQRGGYHHDERHQNQDQKADDERVRTNLANLYFLVSGHLLNFNITRGHFQIYPGQEADDDEKYGSDRASQAVIGSRISKGYVKGVINEQIRFARDPATDHFRAAGCEQVDEVEVIKVKRETRDENRDKRGKYKRQGQLKKIDQRVASVNRTGLIKCGRD